MPILFLIITTIAPRRTTQLVAKDVVLSAAHCAGYSSHIELGRHDKSQQFDEALHERIEVAYEIKHPGWNPETVDNDFMLMKLVRPSEKHPTVKLNTDPNFPSIPGEKLTLMGWGVSVFNCI